jgi:mono/diheme cytochrome c family protein
MKHSTITMRFVGLVLGTVLSLASCFPEPDGMPIHGAGGTGGQMMTEEGGAPDMSDAGAAGTTGGTPFMCVPRAAVEGAQCHPAQSAESLGARAVDGVPRARIMFREDLYKTMDSYCGSCHKAPAALGGFTFSSGTFATIVDQKVISVLKSENQTCERDNAGNKVDPDCYNYMPPKELGGKPWSAREKDPNDRLVPFVRLLSVWLEQGRKDTFTVPPQEGDKALFSISQELADTLTNLGTCVPDAGMVGTAPAACDMDARFQAMKRDPNGAAAAARLGLPETLDQTDLTTYDSAELARNGVVGYVPAYPLWTDDAGKLRFVRVPIGQSISYNKKTKEFDIPANTRFYKTFMKKVKGLDGVVRYKKIETRVIVSRPRDENGQDMSLFGTYVWEDDESQANLLITPQNNGEPFVDKVSTLITDEPVAAEVQDLFKKGKVRNYTYELDSRHATRRYAFPSFQRCVQCHMGSPSQSFILGFTPLQLNTRPCSPETIKSNGHCDAGQVEPAMGDELTQVERLTAYGVISGYGEANLAKLEDAQGTPKAPRPMRSTEELVAQGYMLGNCSHCHNPNGYPSVEHPELKPLLNFLPGTEGGIYGFPFERYSPRVFRNKAGDGPIAYITPSLRDRYAPLDGWKPKFGSKGGVNGLFIDAPWRSLIYRNVDSPFTYVDDSAIYPHMPLNSPGFDCRAPRIMGEWMVSIPALQKNPNLTEDVLPGFSPDAFTELDPQPYREVKPGDPDFANGASQASKRLAAFRSGLRAKNYCPDTSDIVDLNVERSNGGQLIPTDQEVQGLPVEGVPDKPHWVGIDLTNPPGDWNPRRPDWKEIILNQDFSKVDMDFSQDPPVPLLAQAQASLDAQKRVVAQLQSVTLTEEFTKFAKKPQPFGIWQQKPGCKFDGQPKLGSFKGQDRQRWMDIATETYDGKEITPDSPVYSAAPGALVFSMICVNCHGPDADSGGRQATTLAEMTGGTARVANFRDGLFGPFGKGGENRRRIFGTDDVAARYLPWMALGGTSARIPLPILNLVANTPVLGKARKKIDVTSANMLQTAQALCSLVGGMELGTFNPAELASAKNQAELHGKLGQFLTDNGDAELWTRICTYNNPPPVHVLEVVGGALTYYAVNTYFPQNYPAGSPIGNGKGQVEPTLTAATDTPWCVKAPAGDAAPPANVPLCPPSFLVEANRFRGGAKDPNTSIYKPGDLDEWGARGAINAGLAVFVYLDGMISQGKGRDLRFDECEQLEK